MQKHKRPFIRTVFLILLLFPYWLLTSCDSDRDDIVFDLNDRPSETESLQIYQDHQHESAILFGFDLRASPQEDARQYLPFLKYLETSTGYQFKLHFTAKNDSIIDDLGNNHVQFAAIGATAFLEAQSRYGQVVPLVRGINHQGKAEYRSIFVVRPDSKIKVITDLKGKHLAFGSISSTQGHLIPRIILAKYNIGLNDLAYYDYMGSHQKCASAVVSRKFDACGMQDTMALNMEKQGLVRILHVSDYYPSSGIAVNKDVSAEIVAKVKQALLDFQPQARDKTSLYHWDKTEMPRGFVAAKVEDYAGLRRWSIRLGFMQADEKQASRR